jgi:hypothetical protein
MIGKLLTLSTLVLLAGCHKNDSFDRFDSRTVEGRVARAEESVGLGGAITIWKCVGNLDDQRMIAVALESHPQHGLMLLVNRVDFSAAPDSYRNEGLYLLEVAADLSSPHYVLSSKGSKRELLAFDSTIQVLEFRYNLTDEGVKSISCSDHSVGR